MDLPIFTFIGAWLLLLSFDAAGVSGLIFPGIFGWMSLLFVVIRVLVTWQRRRPFRPQYLSKRGFVMVWAISAALFLLISSTELFISRWMPQSWKEAAAKTLHVRRVYRNYGPSP
jgi:hypothetical protein